jgi:hypothetical protein
MRLHHADESRRLQNGTALLLISTEMHAPLEVCNEGALQVRIRTLNSLIADFGRGSPVDGERSYLPSYFLGTS